MLVEKIVYVCTSLIIPFIGFYGAWKLLKLAFRIIPNAIKDIYSNQLIKNKIKAFAKFVLGLILLALGLCLFILSLALLVNTVNKLIL